MNLYQQIIAKSRYARYIDKEKRRETWEETVDRLIDYLQTKVPDTYTNSLDRTKRKCSIS